MKIPNGQRIVVLIVIWGLSAAYLVNFIDRGWIPHDEGSLAHSAERVLAGELPHRDFAEIYTGGLSYLHAIGFKLMGVKLTSLRLVLFAFFLVFVPALFGIASRLAPPVIAGVVVLLGVVWSVPNYFAAIPSWYNLFFATFGTLALLRHVETDQHRWLFVAGLCGGLSFLVKLAGIYYLAAALLFLTYREQILSSVEEPQQGEGFSAFFLLKGVVYALFSGLLIFLLRSRLASMELLHFFLPGLAVSAFLIWSEWKEGRGEFCVRLKKLSRLLIPFVLGVMLPVALFLIPYFLADALNDFYRGVFLLPQRRLQNASMSFPPLFTVFAAIPYAVVLIFPPPAIRSRLDGIIALTAVVLLAGALGAADNWSVYRTIWYSVRSLSVVAALIGCFMLARSVRSNSIPHNKRQEVLLLVTMTALLSLVQFPFAAPIYFCYTAPLVALALLSVVNVEPSAPKLLHLCILAFYFLFALLWTNTGYVWNLGVRYTAYQSESVLNLERGGLRVNATDKHEYKDLVGLIQKKQEGGYIYAAPDCPEVYFLSGLLNPTRAIFDFLDDSKGLPSRIPNLLEEKKVKVIVINRDPHFSPPLNPEVVDFLEARFPRWIEIGRFIVRWKE